MNCTERLNEIATLVNGHQDAIISNGRKSLSEALACGALLEEAFKLLKGQFGKWVTLETKLTTKTAKRYRLLHMKKAAIKTEWTLSEAYQMLGITKTATENDGTKQPITKSTTKIDASGDMTDDLPPEIEDGLEIVLPRTREDAKQYLMDLVESDQWDTLVDALEAGQSINIRLEAQGIIQRAIETAREVVKTEVA